MLCKIKTENDNEDCTFETTEQLFLEEESLATVRPIILLPRKRENIIAKYIGRSEGAGFLSAEGRTVKGSGTRLSWP